jgi:SAM domain (Sterile alpha motif)
MQEKRMGFEERGMPESAASRKSRINVPVPPHLSEQDLKGLGISRGHRQKIVAHQQTR